VSRESRAKAPSPPSMPFDFKDVELRIDGKPVEGYISIPAGPPKRETLLSKLKDPAGGITRMPSIDEVLDEMNQLNDWEERTARLDHFYFSGLFKCFRFDWYKSRKYPCNHGKPVNDCEVCRFDSGKSEAGVGTENSIRRLYATVLNYGRTDGPILNDIRFSIPIEVSWVEEEESQKKPGKYIARNKKATVYLVGKTDTVIQGDNQRVVGFTELKTPQSYFVVEKIKKVTESLGTKRVPLTIAGIQEDDNPRGIVSLPQVAQMAVGAFVLHKQGRTPDVAVLQTVSRANYREHIEVVVTPEEYGFLYDLALWWVREAHINRQFDSPPAPEFFTGYDCTYCPFSDECIKENKRTGQQRVIHPMVPGIDGRIKALHAQPVQQSAVDSEPPSGQKAKSKASPKGRRSPGGSPSASEAKEADQ
jgi:hypothetical protein